MKPHPIFVNAAHTIIIVLPLAMHFYGDLQYLADVMLSATSAVGISFATSALWARSVDRTNGLAVPVHPEKERGLATACWICFQPLWLIPTRSPFPISDAAWAISVKRHGNTVRAAISASSDSRYFVVGALSLLGFYIGFSADFGITLTRLSRATGGASAIQVALIALSAWASAVFFFNGFFRAFLARGK